jgi:hypothetical protein
MSFKFKIFVIESCNYYDIFWNRYLVGKGAHGSVVLKALYYKPEGRGFDIR